jgi:outer membrane lipoprotein SlyB
MLTDTGIYRTYDVPSTGDIRVGDRIRVENGVIYLS